MIKNKVVEGTANAVAAFLHSTNELSKEKIGEYLGWLLLMSHFNWIATGTDTSRLSIQKGEREDFAIATLDQFVAQVNFDGVEFDKGLRLS